MLYALCLHEKNASDTGGCLKIFLTFVTEFGSRDFLVRDEKGIRCETGAVPAAVSLKEKFSETSPLSVQTDGKASEDKASQKTCQNLFKY
jgi:hypothetical protein